MIHFCQTSMVINTNYCILRASNSVTWKYDSFPNWPTWRVAIYIPEISGLFHPTLFLQHGKLTSLYSLSSLWSSRIKLFSFLSLSLHPRLLEHPTLINHICSVIICLYGPVSNYNTICSEKE